MQKLFMYKPKAPGSKQTETFIFRIILWRNLRKPSTVESVKANDIPRTNKKMFWNRREKITRNCFIQSDFDIWIEKRRKSDKLSRRQNFGNSYRLG